MIKLIVFDFDGTLVDSKKIIFSVVYRTIKKYNYRISKAQLNRELGSRHLSESLKKLRIKPKDISAIVKDSDYETSLFADKVTPAENLLFIKTLPVKKIILSNNNKKFISTAKKKLKLDFFSATYSADDFKLKYQKLKQIINSYNLSPKEVLYIGDKTIDVDVARKANCISAVIIHKASWSAKKEVLAKNPDIILSNLRDLKSLINLD